MKRLNVRLTVKVRTIPHLRNCACFRCPVRMDTALYCVLRRAAWKRGSSQCASSWSVFDKYFDITPCYWPRIVDPTNIYNMNCWPVSGYDLFLLHWLTALKIMLVLACHMFLSRVSMGRNTARSFWLALRGKSRGERFSSSPKHDMLIDMKLSSDVRRNFTMSCEQHSLGRIWTAFLPLSIRDPVNITQVSCAQPR